jgi:hypothetical protein
VLYLASPNGPPDHCLPNVRDRHGALVMTRITLAVALLTLALPAMALAQGSHSDGPLAAPSAKTEKFVNTTANANKLEVQSSQITLQKTTNEQVKDSLNLMINDHTRIGGELKLIAQKQNLQLPKGVDSKSRPYSSGGNPSPGRGSAAHMPGC